MLPCRASERVKVAQIRRTKVITGIATSLNRTKRVCQGSQLAVPVPEEDTNVAVQSIWITIQAPAEATNVAVQSIWSDLKQKESKVGQLGMVSTRRS